MLQDRKAALQHQINPHFLFNTLNSVSSLVRIDPDTARQLIIKLATILRRLLHSSDAFVPLQEEIDFIRQITGRGAAPKEAKAKKE